MLSTGCATAGAEAPKRVIVLRLLGGESIERLSRELSVPVYKLERWRTKAEAGSRGAEGAGGRHGRQRARHRHAPHRRADHG
jgi:transposase-like protein